MTRANLVAAATAANQIPQINVKKTIILCLLVVVVLVLVHPFHKATLIIV